MVRGQMMGTKQQGTCKKFRLCRSHSQYSLTCQEFLKAQRDVPIPIIIIPLEHIRHPLQDNTALHEEIEAHPALATLIVARVEQVDESLGEPVAKGHEGVGVFGEGDRTGSIFVEAVKEGAPGGEEGP